MPVEYFKNKNNDLNKTYYFIWSQSLFHVMEEFEFLSLRKMGNSDSYIKVL